MHSTDRTQRFSFSNNIPDTDGIRQFLHLPRLYLTGFSQIQKADLLYVNVKVDIHHCQKLHIVIVSLNCELPHWPFSDLCEDKILKSVPMCKSTYVRIHNRQVCMYVCTHMHARTHTRTHLPAVKRKYSIYQNQVMGTCPQTKWSNKVDSSALISKVANSFRGYQLHHDKKHWYCK